jgi:hypothetical protein
LDKFGLDTRLFDPIAFLEKDERGAAEEHVAGEKRLYR